MCEKPTRETFETYIQADAPARADMFAEFIAGLKSLPASCAPVAADWARRAATLDLDYSGHLALHKIIAKAPVQAEPLRIAVLGGPTTSQFVWLLQNFLEAHGTAAQIFEGEYGVFRQAIMEPDPALDEFRPQIVFLAVNVRDVPDTSASMLAPEAATLWIEEEARQWRHLWQTANRRWGAQIIQNLFEIPPWNVFGHYARRLPASREQLISRLNQALVENAPGHVVFHDLQMLALEAEAGHWFDPRYYYDAKMPCAPECLPAYAHSVAALVLALKGKSRKVLVLDLDNTLWGGVVGDEGTGGIRIGQGSAEGESYLAFQKYARMLSRRGVVLAVCSKNDDANAREPFEKLDEMALKMEDFSCFIANWTNKSDNLRTIAMELNLGLDSFVFVDDNPAERALIRRCLPQVAVPDMPLDPADFIKAIARHRYFELVALTDEDIQRSDYYRQNRRRQQMADAHADMDSFLKSLGMEARVAAIGATNLERSTQLINKSNQFNLTTRRYTSAQIKEIMNSQGWTTLTISLRDKLGDNGLISVLLAEQQGADLAIDTWVMSCRVLQRGVEMLALEELCAAARERGCQRLLGRYIPTAKNHMVSDHFAKLGFQRIAGEEGGGAAWALPIANVLPARRHYIETVK